ncbi:MAG: class D sortase [Clostridia bacterium]|nr:class D sortase [Clostridia bacterium]
MISFTKRYVNFISLIISIVIFCFLNNQILNEKIQIQNFSVSSKVQQISQDLENENNQQVSVSKQNKNKQQENQPIAVNTNNQDKKKETNNAKKQENNQNKNSDLIWQLEIPAINLKALIAEGTSKETMDEYVGHFEETVKKNGNIGLAAHNRGYKVNYFHDLKKLKEGDEIIYKYKEFEKRYVVKTLKIISDEDWSWLENTEDNRITLITCVENEPSYRRLVQGIEKFTK